MNTSNVETPLEAPGPSSSIISQNYQDRVVIYDTQDAGWESRLSIRIDDPHLVLNIESHR